VSRVFHDELTASLPFLERSQPCRSLPVSRPHNPSSREIRKEFPLGRAGIPIRADGSYPCSRSVYQRLRRALSRIM